jgi:hypothetical protein
MGTRATIIGKNKNGEYCYCQTWYDGYNNTGWLQEHMSNPDEVEQFLAKITKRPIRCLTYEENKKTNSYKWNSPKVKWEKFSKYDNGKTLSKERIYKLLTGKNLSEYEKWDFVGLDYEYISFWDGEKWIGTGGDFWEHLANAELMGDKDCNDKVIDYIMNH